MPVGGSFLSLTITVKFFVVLSPTINRLKINKIHAEGLT